MTEAVSQLNTPQQRVATCDWTQLAEQLDEQGYALTAPLLSPVECEELVNLYTDAKAFRSRVVMERHSFGRGEYQYFASPLPQLVAELRKSFYPPLTLHLTEPISARARLARRLPREYAPRRQPTPIRRALLFRRDLPRRALASSLC
jgi:hypothetical protein